MRPSADVLILMLQVGLNYDPMIAKVISHGPDRLSALQTLDTALSQLQVSLVGWQPNILQACFGQQLPDAAEPLPHDLAWCEAALYQFGLCRRGLPPCPPTAVQQMLPCALQMSVLQTGPPMQQGLCQLV